MPPNEQSSQTERTWHEREMKLASRRKESWLDNRGRVVTWFVESWPAPFWLGSCQTGLLAGALVGFGTGVVLLG